MTTTSRQGAKRCTQQEVREAVRVCRVLKGLGQLRRSKASGFVAQVTDYLTDEWDESDTKPNWTMTYMEVLQVWKAQGGQGI